MSRVIAYIDHGSPYSYQAWYRIVHNPDRYPTKEFDWVPVSAGHIFHQDGGKPNASYPNMLAYNKRDLERWADALDIPYKMNSVFPQRSIEAARIHHHLAHTDTQAAARWTAACFQAHWVDDRDISRLDTLVSIAEDIGLDVDVRLAVDDPDAKKALIAATSAAYESGAPGVPYFVIDGAGYWGHDRLEWVLARLLDKPAPELV